MRDSERDQPVSAERSTATFGFALLSDMDFPRNSTQAATGATKWFREAGE